MGIIKFNFIKTDIEIIEKSIDLDWEKQILIQ
jgi:hypothetical protein